MSETIVTRWARYGHDRLYVTAADGTRLGYLDNKTGTAVAEQPAHLPALHDALARHRAAGDSGPLHRVPAQTVQNTPPPTPAPAALPPAAAATAGPDLERPDHEPEPEPAWRDLAATRPGAAAREQAVALKQAAPVRTFLARALGVKTDERAWLIGADAEEEVARRLQRLGDRWRTLHAIPVGDKGSDIDHVVIGPGGVFTVNTKHHPDAAVWVGGNTVMVDGHRVPYVRNSRFEADRTSRYLTAALGAPVFVTGVVAVMGATGGFTVKAQPPDGDVHVTTRKDLTGWLTRRTDVLTDDQVEAVYTVARRSDTWR